MDLPTRAADGHAFTTYWTPAAAPSSRNLLFLPALGVPANRYARFAAALAAGGIGVAVPEWRGLDTSSLRPARNCDWGYPELVRLDVPAALAAVRAQAPGATWAIGGHSLGGQLAALAAAFAPTDYDALVFVATGVPDASLFAARHRLGVRLFAQAIPPLTRLFGHFPGKHLRWAGTEAATLMRQWASTVRRGDYAEVGLPEAEARLRALALPVLALRFADDWLAQAPSLEALVAKLSPGRVTRETFDAARLGDAADHFRWMKSPAGPAQAIAAFLR
jgi:predicted alpha/beta hydrolase